MFSIDRPPTSIDFMKSLSKFIFVFTVLMFLGPIPARAASDFVKSEDGGTVITVGGALNNSQDTANEQCRANRPFVRHALLFKEHANIRGRFRYFECSFHRGEPDKVRPSSMEQRTIQSRRLSKKYQDVKLGIESWAKDQGGRAFVTKEQRNRVERSAEGTLSGEMSIAFQFSTSPYHLRITVELNESSDSSIIRVRTFDHLNNEFFNLDTYSMIFSGIAQQLFIEAIEIQPQELQ
jgi:hypothetical protein